MLTRVHTLLDRARVVLTSAVTRITALAALVAAVAPQVVDQLPGAWQGTATQIVAQGLAVAAAVVTIIRRVTPVPEPERGLLPKENS